MRAWILVAALGLTGCFVQVDEPPPLTVDPCEDVACSEHGYCDAGECFCEPYYIGNAYALHGCQPTGAVPGACDTTCGLNAFCDGSGCACVEGYVAVCGTGDCMPVEQVCDGVADCVNDRDEDPEVCDVAEVQHWSLADDCVDGLDVHWRLWAQDRGWVWPSLDDAFVTEGVGVAQRASIECIRGETICLGAEAGGVQWGVGLDGTTACDDCCHPCVPGVIEFGSLACP